MHDMKLLNNLISKHTQATFMLRTFGLLKIPLLSYVKPSVVSINNEKIIVKIPFKRRNKNHLNSMYFGALCIGADCAGGLLAMRCIEKHPEKISLIFKNVSAEFLKRAEDDAYFTCEQGNEISSFVTTVAQSGDRAEMPINVTVTVPDKFGDAPVAIFNLTLSLKKK